MHSIVPPTATLNSVTQRRECSTPWHPNMSRLPPKPRCGCPVEYTSNSNRAIQGPPCLNSLDFNSSSPTPIHSLTTLLNPLTSLSTSRGPQRELVNSSSVFIDVMPPYGPGSLARELRSVSSVQNKLGLLKARSSVISGAEWSTIEGSGLVKALLEAASNTFVVSASLHAPHRLHRLIALVASPLPSLNSTLLCETS